MASFRLWRWKRFACLCADLLVLLTITQLCTNSIGVNIGFCMDNVPAALTNTGFAAVSSLDQASCPAALWCKLADDQKSWTTVEHGTIVYYYFSPCCNGKQGTNLKVDSVGLPTCINNRAATSCTRFEWHNKFMADYIDGFTRTFNSPSTVKMDAYIYGGTNITPACICSTTDPKCERMDSAGTQCLICNSDARCGNDTIHVSINFFKIYYVDLKTSELSFAVWFRQSWLDPRLSYDYQCYGGLPYFEAMAETSNRENSQIWTPDLELYNMAESIWSGNFPPRMAKIYACSDQLPTRGGCGYVYFSRPGLLHGLCKYEGLVRFPYDNLKCTLEFGAWSLDGRFQDINLNPSDGGVDFLMEEDSDSIIGLTAGSSFQDYTISGITARRTIVKYPGAGAGPWPELLYTIEFTRSNSFYAIQLMLPGCLLAVLSFIPFWMNPVVTDRLGYGVTLILALITNQIVSNTYMPVCEERVVMDYFSYAFLFFGGLSLLETCIVLYMHHLHCDSWTEALVPRWMRGLASGRVSNDLFKNRAKRVKSISQARDNKGYQLRRQLYHQIFYAIDHDFSGTLGLEEIEEFGIFICGHKWDMAEAEAFLKKMDSSWDGVLDYEEFTDFCEGNLLAFCKEDIEFLKSMIKGFLVILEKKFEARRLMWKSRAIQLDQFCRWAIPPGFFFFVILCMSLSEESLEYASTRRMVQIAITLSGFYPIMAIILVYVTYTLLTNGCLATVHEARQDMSVKLFKSLAGGSEARQKAKKRALEATLALNQTKKALEERQEARHREQDGNLDPAAVEAATIDETEHGSSSASPANRNVKFMESSQDVSPSARRRVVSSPESSDALLEDENDVAPLARRPRAKTKPKSKARPLLSSPKAGAKYASDNKAADFRETTSAGSKKFASALPSMGGTPIGASSNDSGVKRADLPTRSLLQPANLQSASSAEAPDRRQAYF